MSEKEEVKQVSTLAHRIAPGLRCDGWGVYESTLPTTLSESLLRESFFSMGNGLVAVRGYLEECEQYSVSESSSVRTGYDDRSYECSKPSNRGVYVAGFIEHCGHVEMPSITNSGNGTGKTAYLMCAPDPFCINVFVGGEHVSSNTGRVICHSRRLDLRTGELHRVMEWESSQQKRRVRIESTRMLSCVKKNIGAIRYTIHAKRTHNTDIRVVSSTVAPSSCASKRSCCVESVVGSSDMKSSSCAVVCRTKRSCRRVAVATYEKCVWNSEGEALSKPQTFLNAISSPDGSSSSQKNFPLGKEDADCSSILQHSHLLSWVPMVPQTIQRETGSDVVYSCSDSNNVCIDIVKFVGFFTDDHAPLDELREYAENQVRYAAGKGYDALYTAHQQKMEQLWETVDVKITTDPEVCGAFRFNALQVLMSSSSSPLYSLPCKGLASTAPLSGSLTWEVDALIIPYLCHVCPHRARILLEFRCRTLDFARLNAHNADLPRGAWYPYRTVTGSDGEVPFHKAFIFVNAVIAFAMRQYVIITNDFSILFKDGGAAVVLASALLYLHWGCWDKGAFHLQNVSGPDVLSGVVDNNLFTNLLVQQHMEWVVQIASVCRKNDPTFWAKLLESNNSSEEDIRRMETCAQHLMLPFDAKNRVYAMDENFMKRSPWMHTDPLMQPGWGGNGGCFCSHPQISRFQLCTVPDVVLACIMLPEKFSHDEILANFRYYEALTVPWNSEISLGIFCVVAAQLRLHEKANQYFRQTVLANLSDAPSNVEGLNCATAALSWWVLAAGFAGMRVHQGVLHFSPTLPMNCEDYQLVCRHNGCIIRVRVLRRYVEYLLVENGSASRELPIVHAENRRVLLKCGIEESVPRSPDILHNNFDGVIFDLSVLVSNYKNLCFKAWQSVLDPFLQVKKKCHNFSVTKDLFGRFLQEDQPIEGLKKICEEAHLSFDDLSDDEPPFLTGETVLANLSNAKNDALRRCIEQDGLEFREGALALLAMLREHEVGVGCVWTDGIPADWLLTRYPKLKVLLDNYVDGMFSVELQSASTLPQLGYFLHCAKKLSTPLARLVLFLEDSSIFASELVEPFAVVADLQAHSCLREESSMCSTSSHCLSSPNAPSSKAQRSVSFARLGDVTLEALDRAAMNIH